MQWHTSRHTRQGAANVNGFIALLKHCISTATNHTSKRRRHSHDHVLARAQEGKVKQGDSMLPGLAASFISAATLQHSSATGYCKLLCNQISW